MVSYWTRQRLLVTIIMCVSLALIMSLLFVFPYVEQRASSYDSQSIYKNTAIDFIVPEPSFDQAQTLPGANGIASVFPFYLTKTTIEINGKTRTTTVLIANQKQSLDGTMYNTDRLVKQSGTTIENPVVIDWKFAQDTGANIGDTLTITIGSSVQEYKISAIYETNSIYENGAILIQVTDEQIDSIQQGSLNNGYSAMYVTASDYDTCRLYLTTEYRPLGRLKTRDQFADDEQYQIHYDAIMSSAYSNEITDFRIRANELDKSISSLPVWLGAILSMAIVIAFNVIMSRRGCEKPYFTRHCIPNGQDVKPYYILSFVCELACYLIAYAISLIICANSSATYIPRSAWDLSVWLFPISVIIAEIICFTIINHSVYTAMQDAVVHLNVDRKPLTPVATISVNDHKDSALTDSSDDDQSSEAVQADAMSENQVTDHAEKR